MVISIPIVATADKYVTRYWENAAQVPLYFVSGDKDGNKLPSELMYGNTKVKPLRLRPGTNTPITIDDTDFFVQQQYVDFLSRFPDQSGFAFWQGEINQCGANAQCVEVRRIHVSGAFFRSIEFQATGYHVYKTLKLRVVVYQDDSVEVSGTFGESLDMCQSRTRRAGSAGRGVSDRVANAVSLGAP